MDFEVIIIDPKDLDSTPTSPNVWPRPSFLRPGIGIKRITWYKKDGDFVDVNDKIANVSYLSSKNLSNVIEKTIIANSSGYLRILVSSNIKIEQPTVIARIEKNAPINASPFVDDLKSFISLSSLEPPSVKIEALQPITVFYSYDGVDESFRKSLEIHLSNLRSQQILTDWHDQLIRPGEDKEATIASHIDGAQIILLLISPDFIASDYLYKTQVQKAIQRHKAGDAFAIPILLRHVDWKYTHFETLSKALPHNGQPVSSWPDRDAAFVDVVLGIRETIQTILKKHLEISQRQLQIVGKGLENLNEGYMNLGASNRIDIIEADLKQKSVVIKQQMEDLTAELQSIQNQLVRLEDEKHKYEQARQVFLRKAASVLQQQEELNTEIESIKAVLKKVE